MKTTLLRTKLNAPQLPPKLVIRSDLLAKLNDGIQLGHRLILVSAPVGFGKTVLVAEWLAHLNNDPDALHAFGWLSLDESDSDLVRFLSYILAVFRQIEPEFGRTVEELLQAPQPPNLEILLTNLINDLAEIPLPFILVLDDYHLIQSAPIHTLVDFLIEHAPPRLHVLIASRADPPLKLARLRARGQLTEIRENELRFSQTEASHFLNQVMDLALSKNEVRALDERTEGWIAGLQLAGLALRSLETQTHGTTQPTADRATFIRSFSGSDRFILDYLVEEVLSLQSETVKEFLIKTAILERLCGSLCDDVTGNGGSQQMLEWLEQSHLFILPLDNERYWFRYHHLFRDLLRHHAQQLEPKRVAGYHQRASIWFEENGWIGEAISHAISAGDNERSVHLVETNAIQSLANGELFALKGWLQMLPERIRLSRLWLSIFQAWVYLLTGQLDKIDAWLPDAQRLSSSECIDNYSGEDCQQMAGHSAAIRAYATIYKGDIQGAVKAGQQALAWLPETDLVVRSFVAYTLGGAYLFSDDLENAYNALEEASSLAKLGGNIHILLPAQRTVASLQMAGSHLNLSAQTCQVAIQWATYDNGRRSPVASIALGTLGSLHYEWNNLNEAQGFLAEALDLGKRWGEPNTAMGNYVRMARVQYALGQVEMGDQNLRAAVGLLQSQQLTPGTAGTLINLQIKNWTERGMLSQVTNWLGSTTQKSDSAVTFINLEEHLALARALLFKGDHHLALKVLTRLNQWAHKKNLNGILIQVLTLEARVWLALGKDTQACASLEQALALGKPEGYQRTFLDEGPQMGVLLRKLSSQGIEKDYAGQLLAALEAEIGETLQTEHGIRHIGEIIIEPISERETEILILIGKGLTNQQIAEQLVISLGTVKAHTSNIYRKMGVRNRTQALARARELDLL